jgi:hypothetical protein
MSDTQSENPANHAFHHRRVAPIVLQRARSESLLLICCKPPAGLRKRVTNRYGFIKCNHMVKSDQSDSTQLVRERFAAYFLQVQRGG